MTTNEHDQIVDDYLRRLDAALGTLDTESRRQLLDELRAHIAESRARFGEETEADIRTLLERLGTPEEIAAEALSSDTTAKTRRRRRQWRAALVVVVGLVVLAALGASLAAVETQRRPTRTAGVERAKRAMKSYEDTKVHKLTHTADWNEATEVIRVVAPGPDGTTLLVGSSSGRNGTCEALAVRVSGAAKPKIVGGSCGAKINIAHPTSTTPQAASTYSKTKLGWTSPTGSRYGMSFGQAPSGTTSVAFVSPSGSHLVTGTASGGWYVIAVPASDLGHGNAVKFYGLLGTGPVGLTG